MTDPAEWRRLAKALADELQRRGFIKDPVMQQAFAEIPRHLFVPAFYGSKLNELGYDAWDWEHLVEEDDPSWLTAIYSDQPLVIQARPVQGRPEQRWPASSSSKPSLMADMINELIVRPGMSVLEVGTGTGYNAAILCYLFGDANVTTTDIDTDLVEQARRRLATLGYHPSFDPEPAAYDRLLATHAVDAIPSEWIRWTKPGGAILTDLRSVEMHDSGAWAVLTVHDDGTATGHLMESRGSFMGAKRTPETIDAGTQTELTDEELQRRAEQMAKRSTDLGYRILGDPSFALLLWTRIPGLRWSVVDGQASVSAADGRWADVANGNVLYGGPSDLWAEVESIHRAWCAARRPAMETWTVRATSQGTEVELPA